MELAQPFFVALLRLMGYRRSLWMLRLLFCCGRSCCWAGQEAIQADLSEVQPEKMYEIKRSRKTTKYVNLAMSAKSVSEGCVPNM